MKDCNKCINYQEPKSLKEIGLDFLSKMIGFVIGCIGIIYLYGRYLG